jgi:DNA-binding CsgD family transcriptional regulator
MFPEDRPAVWEKCIVIGTTSKNFPAMLTEPVEYIPPVVDKARYEYAVVCDSDTGFTPGEERIYGQLLEFKTAKEIAEKPRVATNTVINHRQKIYHK